MSEKQRPGNQAPDLAFLVGAFEQSVRSLLTAVDNLPSESWGYPTDLPGWTARDVVAHVAAIESELSGQPTAPPLEAFGDHVRDDFGRHMENGVDARRTRPVEDVVAELATALEERLPQMRAMSADSPPTRVPAGKQWDTRLLLSNRVVDAWMHEQDFRRAVNRPGNLDGPGATVVRETIVGALPYVLVKRCGGEPGASLRLVATGPVEIDTTALVGPDGRASTVRDPDAAAATAVLTTDWQTLVRIFGGRVPADEAEVTIGGDAGLAGRAVSGLRLTP